jgi:hypothetical protein
MQDRAVSSHAQVAEDFEFADFHRHLPVPGLNWEALKK